MYDIADWIDLFVAAKRRRWSDATEAAYLCCLGQFERWLATQPPQPLGVRDRLRALVGRWPTHPLTPPIIEAYLLSFKDAGRAAATIDNNYRMIKTFCRWLYEHEHIDRDPFAGRGRIEPHPKKRRRVKTYADEQIAALLAVELPTVRTLSPRWAERSRGFLIRECSQGRALILVLCDTGVRIGEVARLTCGDVRAAEIVVKGKGDHDGVVFLSDWTRAALLDLAGDRPDTAALFLDRSGKPATTRALRGCMKRLAKRAGVTLPARPIHAFRHYFARKLLAAGVPTRTIQQFMRHSQFSTTVLYTELDAHDLAAIHQRVSPVPALLRLASLAGA